MADRYGLLRTDGFTEKAIVVIDKEGIIQYIGVGDINKRPRLQVLVKELERLEK